MSGFPYHINLWGILETLSHIQRAPRLHCITHQFGWTLCCLPNSSRKRQTKFSISRLLIVSPCLTWPHPFHFPCFYQLRRPTGSPQGFYALIETGIEVTVWGYLGYHTLCVTLYSRRAFSFYQAMYTSNSKWSTYLFSLFPATAARSLHRFRRACGLFV